jgi:hypothetical protein
LKYLILALALVGAILSAKPAWAWWGDPCMECITIDIGGRQEVICWPVC